ncbi:Receptor-type tyrosine-protein phosphatase mu, partial [Dissostichus eleginoides]
RGSLTEIPVVKTTRVESGQFLFLSVLCMIFILVALLVSTTFFCLRQRSHLRLKEKLSSLGTDTSTDATATYQELCRQRMAIRTSERVERPETLRNSRLNSVSSQFSDGPAASPSTRSSTSSWCEEPSYMEDHLKNKNRLEREWEALCSYQAEPGAWSVGHGEQNSRKNRSDAVVVYDHSRITLKAENNHGNSDYINASPIMDHDPRNPTYISSQGPLLSTVADFWQMVWESGCVVVVMLTPLSENGVKQCHPYWPDEGSDVYHIYEVNLVSEHIWCEDFLVRSFYLKNLQTNETRTVTQFHFLSWMDRGIPNSARTLLDFRSDGASRSGTYILIDMVLNRMAKGAKEIDIAATLEHLRDQRAGMVQTKSKEDDFDWEEGDTRERPSSSPWIPAGSSFLFVNTSGRYSGQRAQLLMPPLKENDTHCVSFLFYQAGGREGATPATLNVVFEAVSTGQRGVLAIKDITLQGHQCSVEVNAGQTAQFHCTVNGHPQSNLLLYLQGMGGRQAVVRETKPVNSRRYVASFDVENTTKGDSGRYRCLAQSERGVGVSSYADLTVKQPPVPIAPPQLTAVGATYLWIQLNANSINGDGPIIEREVEYRTMSGMLIDTTPVDKPTHKIGHLDPDTEYEISVLLTRPLDGGTGNPGPPLRARTKCAGVFDEVLKVGDVQSKQVTVRWEPFGYNVTRCYSYNLTVQYHYRPAGGASREPVKEEVVYDALSGVPQHILRNLPPFTNVSLKLVLSNPEGRKESEELLVLTDEDVPGAVPVDSIIGSSYEQQISLSWKEPLQTYGLIRQYEISYKALSSFDTEFDLSNQSGKVFKPANETSHVFSGLFPGSTYSFTIRASTVKGFGPPVITQFTTKIS